MRVGIFTKNGAALDLTDMFTLDFDTATAEVPQLVGKPAPDLLLVNHGDDDFIKIRLDERPPPRRCATSADWQTPWTGRWSGRHSPTPPATGSCP